MSIVVVILLVFAFVLFTVAALGVPSPPRFNLVAAGLAFWVLSLLVSTVGLK